MTTVCEEKSDWAAKFIVSIYNVSNLQVNPDVSTVKDISYYNLLTSVLGFSNYY